MRTYIMYGHLNSDSSQSYEIRYFEQLCLRYTITYIHIYIPLYIHAIIYPCHYINVEELFNQFLLKMVGAVFIRHKQKRKSE